MSASHMFRWLIHPLSASPVRPDTLPMLSDLPDLHTESELHSDLICNADKQVYRIIHSDNF